eukprot:Plantae.Rhodophyta-Purpureofilum_apyrenoidigerum.ctg23614.p1 GENE.Plantae.Rhodophyta-Purpureofilum_apyrenoidigerum.ctg23614~~Plantae.Rhodophyta-Purpureofilum_apyrenoidigerum.ctg23614.p1  ORF type:complete len:207 (-),score=42.23 Plantae.Rhodophyta-Purpureofilum_apyrenoidigerum.ctg23614:432-1013(-)
MAPSDRREVLETSLELLLIELVHILVHREEDLSAQLAKSVRLGAKGGEARLDDSPVARTFDPRFENRAIVEKIGFHVGERMVERLAVGKRVESDLDAVKFICKEFWEALFNKHVDVLKTNHKGLFVLHDNNFRWISKLSHNEGATLDADDFVAFPAGLLCGALTRMGVQCKIVAEAQTPPKCIFTLQVIPAAQ